MKNNSNTKLTAILAASLGLALSGPVHANEMDKSMDANSTTDKNTKVELSSKDKKAQKKGKDASCKGKDGSCKGKDASCKGKDAPSESKNGGESSSESK